MATRFRFSYNVFGLSSRAEFTGICRRAEQFGYDTVFTGDHLGIASPFPTLVAAAQATERLRVGTLTLNAAFWNPALLAREIATTDLLTDGRLEVGLGAGHMKWEFDEAGIPWQPLTKRVEHLRATITELRRLFSSEGYEQQAAQRAAFGGIPVLNPLQRTGFGGYGPPLLVGGTGERLLRIAAETADIIAFGGLFQIKGQPPGTFRLATAAETDEKVRFARECLGDRADEIERHALVQSVVVTDDRRAAAEKLLADFQLELGIDDVLEVPFVLIGTVEEIAEQILRNRDRYGFTYYTVHGHYMNTFAPVITRVRELEG